jgi:hypothetical protein
MLWWMYKLNFHILLKIFYVLMAEEVSRRHFMMEALTMCVFISEYKHVTESKVLDTRQILSCRRQRWFPEGTTTPAFKLSTSCEIWAWTPRKGRGLDAKTDRSTYCQLLTDFVLDVFQRFKDCPWFRGKRPALTQILYVKGIVTH